MDAADARSSEHLPPFTTDFGDFFGGKTGKPVDFPCFLPADSPKIL